MPLSASEHEVEVEILLEKNRPLKIWLQAIHALTRDEQGRTIAVGLNAGETLEFLMLEAKVSVGQERKARQNLCNEDFSRYTELFDRLQLAIKKDILETVEFWAANRTEH